MISLIRAHLRYALLFSVLLNLLAIVPTLYLLQVYDRVLSSRSLETLGMLAAFALISLCTSWALEVVRGKLLSHAGASLDRKLGRALLIAQLDERARDLPARHGQALRDLALVRGFLSGPAVCVFFDLPWSILYLLIIFLFHWTLGLLASISALLLFALAVLNKRRTKAQVKTYESQQREADLLAAQLLHNAEVIAVLGMAGRMANAWEKLKNRAAIRQEAVAESTAAYKAFTKFLRQLIQVAAMALGAWLVIEQHATGGVMLATTILLGKALAPVEQIIGGWKQFAEVRNAWRRLEAPERREHGPAHTELPSPTGQLHAEQVCFANPADGRPILEDIGFRLEAGETLALIGASASGKSTLARVLTGLLKPHSGSVRLDGGDIAQWPRESLGPYIGYVPQDVELFAGTVAENIARTHRLAGNALIDATAIVRAAQRAQVHDMILRLPQGYETEIGAHGYALSGGQRQRIAFARALYGNPKLLILDEPDANLDTAGELKLQSALRQLKDEGITIIVVTHRTPLIQLTDKVLLLRDGRVDCFGPRASVERWIEERQAVSIPPIRRAAR